jgi:hypothetical protein
MTAGEDAPMDEQSNRFFKRLTIGALVVVGLIVVVSLLTRLTDARSADMARAWPTNCCHQLSAASPILPAHVSR